MEKILYHTGFEERHRHDVRRRRESADFGQGFYLSPDVAFTRRLAQTRKELQSRKRTETLIQGSNPFSLGSSRKVGSTKRET